MPCSTCGTRLLIQNPPNWEKKCPTCDKIHVVNREVAIRISNERLLYLYDLFLRYVKQFKKTRLIAHIIWEREKFARDFSANYQPFDMSRFLAYNFLIKHLMMESFNGTMDANESNTTNLVKTFDKYLELLTDHNYLKEGIGELLADMPFDPSSLTIQEKLSR